jgi:hypothetical protein
VQELENALRFEKVAQPMLAQVTQLDLLWEHAAGKLLDRLREEDLAAVAHREEARQPVEKSGEIVAAVVRNRVNGVQGDTDPQVADLGPLLGMHGALAIERRGNGARGSRKGSLYRIADRIEADAPVRSDGRVEQGEVAIDRGSHRRAVPLPETRTPFDIGEEESDGAGREVGQARLHSRASMEFQGHCLTHHMGWRDAEGVAKAGRSAAQTGPAGAPCYPRAIAP